MSEIWKPIPDTDYAVSNTGKVASMKKGWRVMSGARNSDGYPQVWLYDENGGKRSVTVHKLVAEAFLGQRPTPSHQANHIDGTRDNNRIENLEWVTQSGNQRHRFDVLNHGNTRGEACSWTKLAEAEVREIIRRCAAGETHRRVAADYGVAASTVSMIASHKNWAWLGMEISQ